MASIAPFSHVSVNMDGTNVCISKLGDTYTVPFGTRWLYFWFRDAAMSAAMELEWHTGEKPSDSTVKVTIDDDMVTAVLSSTSTTSIPMQMFRSLALSQYWGEAVCVNTKTGHVRWPIVDHKPELTYTDVSIEPYAKVHGNSAPRHPSIKVQVDPSSTGILSFKTSDDGDLHRVNIHLRNNVMKNEDVVLLPDECKYDSKTKCFLIVIASKRDRTMKLKSAVHVPLLHLYDTRGRHAAANRMPFSCNTVEMDDAEIDIEIVCAIVDRFQLYRRYALFGECKKFETRQELVDTLKSIVDDESLQKACETYGPFTTWDVSEVTDLSGLFKRENGWCPCVSDKEGEEATLDISGWKLATNVASTFAMFEGCDAKRIILPEKGFSVAHTANLTNMFKHCAFLTEVSNLRFEFLPVDEADKKTSVHDGSYKGVVVGLCEMFYNCVSLQSIAMDLKITAEEDLNHIWFDCTRMASFCTSLKESVKFTGSATDFQRGSLLIAKAVAMFHNCYSLKSVETPLQLGMKDCNAQTMFSNCPNLTQAFVRRFFEGNALNIKQRRNYATMFALVGQFQAQPNDVGMVFLGPRRHLTVPIRFYGAKPSCYTNMEKWLAILFFGYEHREEKKFATIPWTIECRSSNANSHFVLTEGYECVALTRDGPPLVVKPCTVNNCFNLLA